MELFDTSEFIINKEKSEPDFYFKIEQLIPWSESELIKDNIPISEVKSIAKIYGFSESKINNLIKAKKYNKKYNPSCDSDWVRLTKVFTK